MSFATVKITSDGIDDVLQQNWKWLWNLCDDISINIQAEPNDHDMIDILFKITL